MIALGSYILDNSQRNNHNTTFLFLSKFETDVFRKRKFYSMAHCTQKSLVLRDLNHPAGSSINSAICEDISKFCIQLSLQKM